jgi:hypothetical protein
LTAKESGIPWREHFANGQPRKGEYSCQPGLTRRRFPIVAGLRVVWDHRKPPNQRVESIHLVDPGNDEDDQGASADDLIDFVEQEDGTRVEVKQKKIQIGAEVKREEGGRIYRVVGNLMFLR